MTFALRLSTFLCVFAPLIWKIGTDSQRVAESHAEEEEKKFNFVSGNISFRSTLPSLTTSEPFGTTESGLSLQKSQSNATEYDELREDVNKNDASPENNVDRETPEVNDAFLEDGPRTESPLDVEEETEPNPVSLNETAVLSSVTSEDDSNAFINLKCSDGDTKCETTPDFETDDVVSPSFSDKVSTSSSTITPLWSIFKSSSVTFTPFKAEINHEIFTVTTESATSVQTSENLIPVEGSVVNKVDPINDTPSNKSEKSKATKHNFSDPSRTFVKISSTTPLSSVTEKNYSTSATLISMMFEAATVLPIETTHDIYLKISNISSWNDSSLPPTEDESDVITPSSSPQTYDMPTDFHNPTQSWIPEKSSIPSHTESVITEGEVVIPHLSPSFHESSLSTKTTPSSSKTIPPASTSSLPNPLTTLQPQLNIPFGGKDTTTPFATTDKEEDIPAPRLTNPACSSLPICIEIALLDTSWDEFCPQAREFQDYVAKTVSHYIHPIHPHQVIIEAESCSPNPPLFPGQPSPDVIVALYITDDSGEYADKLTEICALILRKWGPTTFRNSVLEIRMFSTELQATSIPVIPELTSGFVAAVSISAVAGVALCMLCILLVVMKQKLVQSRGSETTSPSADAYSLDSLSINASFRRRRNRRSARSYLNHAFCDQEIPSHPLNEKSLQNCLKKRELLEEEFKKIPMNMPKLNEIPEGAHVKNRYSNILPKPESRVVLAEPSGDPLKCYINANFVKGYAGKASTYIACQAPLPEGIEDFWRMIWEQQCRTIVMLTMFQENGISRCATYFPQSTLVANPPYGDFQVSLLKKDVYEFYTISTLRLLDMEKNLFRDVVHLWFTSWPDVGVPKDSSSLITFVLECRSFINCNAGPTVVHCSTGTGRTGVFLALDICMREYDESRSIDILQCISQLRRDRGGAVQNKDQYILIHEAMLEYISRMANQSQRSSVQS